MPDFSQSSKDKLATCDIQLQNLFNEVIKTVDCSVICGHRDHAAQDLAFHSGNSKAMWPQSPHNKTPSQAADVVPYPVDWQDTKRFDDFASIVLDTAEKLGIKLTWGGSFKIVDKPHFELEGWNERI